MFLRGHQMRNDRAADRSAPNPTDWLRCYTPTTLRGSHMKKQLALLLSGAALVGGLVLHAQQPKPAVPATTTDDPYLWLEDVTGDKAMAWVRARNAESAKELESGETFKTLEADILKILDSDARIPYVTKQGAYYYNFCRD